MYVKLLEKKMSRSIVFTVFLLHLIGIVYCVPKCVLHPGPGLHSVECDSVGSMHELAVHMQANWHRLSIVNSPSATFTHTGTDKFHMFVCVCVCVFLFVECVALNQFKIIFTL